MLPYDVEMIRNRSVPTDTVLPHIIYSNLVAALEWLPVTFGFTEHYRYGNPVSGAQLSLGGAWVMLKGAPQGSSVPAQSTRRSPCSWKMWMHTTTGPEPPAPKSWKSLRRRVTARGSTAWRTWKDTAGCSRNIFAT